MNSEQYLGYFQDYIDKVNDLYRTGVTTEHSFRGLLATLLEQVISINANNKNDVTYRVVNEPKRDTYGATDYIITKNDIPVGYLEAKDINATDLKGTKKNGGNKEQFDRYKKALGNIAFTNYTHFVFYIGEQFIDEVTLAEVFFSQEFQLNKNEIDKFIRLFNDFVFNDIPTIKTAKRLSNLMARKAKLLANVIENALMSDEESRDNSKLHDLLEGFKSVLIHDLTYRQFADVYAQTIAYGMFAARVNDSESNEFDRIIAAQSISTNNPFLSDLFENISGIKIDPRIKWVVDDLADLFRVTDMKTILKNFGSLTKTQDPFIHFYEDFLSDYDPALRKQRGVWYTPEPVVKFIVRSVDEILKNEFNLSDGIASNEKTTINVEVTGTSQTKGRNKGKAVFEDRIVPKVQILDPATGTGAFLNEVIRYIYENNFENNAGMWRGYVKDNLLPRINGFELLMASYAIAHLKLEMLLKATGYDLQKDQRFKVYLTNSLEEFHEDTGSLFATFLSHEANEANYIKRDSPVMVVIGNPPYKGESANKGKWIMDLMEDYKKEPNSDQRLKEKNPKWINDDYVKFMRYSQHFIEKNGEGILAFINAHGFLDNPTFRGMRWQLLHTYDKIYVLDLHGNAKKKEKTPNGGKDENVFDIQQGVSINLFIKTGKKKKGELAKVYHYDLYGLRKDKYEFLSKNSINTIPYTEIESKSPSYFMVKKNLDGEGIYAKGFSLAQIFKINSVGIVTSRDGFVVDKDKSQLSQRIKDFFELDASTLKSKYNLRESKSWHINDAKTRAVAYDVNKVKEYCYRPFDKRFIYYDENMIERTRYDVMKHIVYGSNIGFVFKLGNAEKNSVSAMITQSLIDFRSWSRAGMQGGDYIAPLYQYIELTNQEDLNFKKIKSQRKPNLDNSIIQEIAHGLDLTFIEDHQNEQAGTNGTFHPLDVLDYIYAVLHSPTYRKTYEEFLKIDFPRIPYPTDKTIFFKLVELGSKLRETHLFEDNKLTNYPTFPISHDNIVLNERGSKSLSFEIHSSENDIGRVWINDVQYFDNVPKIAWEFYIGGYQPAQKWLKDRNGIELSFDDISHYQKIIVALYETDRLMKEIDKILVL